MPKAYVLHVRRQIYSREALLKVTLGISLSTSGMHALWGQGFLFCLLLTSVPRTARDSINICWINSWRSQPYTASHQNLSSAFFLSPSLLCKPQLPQPNRPSGVCSGHSPYPNGSAQSNSSFKIQFNAASPRNHSWWLQISLSLIQLASCAICNIHGSLNRGCSAFCVDVGPPGASSAHPLQHPLSCRGSVHWVGSMPVPQSGWFSFRLLYASSHLLFKYLLFHLPMCLPSSISCLGCAGTMVDVTIISRMHGA